MGLVWQSGLSVEIEHLAAAVQRLEGKLDAAISQAAADRIITQAHIAECGAINKRADEDELNAKSEWNAFKANVFSEIEGLSEKVGRTQMRLGWLIGGVAGIGWAVDHFHLIFGGH